MKKVSAALSFSASLLILASITLWFIAANNMKSQTLQQIDEANAALGLLDAEFSYKKISRTGFPFNVGVAIEGAKLKTNINATQANMPQYLLQFKHPITLTSNLLGNTFHFGIHDYQVKAHSEQNTLQLKIKNKLDVTLAFEGSFLPALLKKEGFKTLAPADLVQQLKLISFHSGQSQIKDSVTNKKYASLDSYYFELSRKKLNADQDTYRLDIAWNNLLTSNEVQTLMLSKQREEFVKTFLNGDTSLLFSKKPESFHLKAEYDSANWATVLKLAQTASRVDWILALTQHPIRFKLLTLSGSNDFGQSDMKGNLLVDLSAPNNLNAQAYAESHLTLNSRLQELFKQIATGYLSQSHNILTTDSEIQGLIPDLESFGTLSQELKLDAHFLNTAQSDANKSGAITASYRFHSKPYQFDLRTEAGLESGQVAIHVNNYAQLVDDLYHYTLTLYQFADRHQAKLAMNTPNVTVPDQFAANVKSFLRAISDTPSSTQSDLNVTLKISSKPSNTSQNTAQTNSSNVQIDQIGTLDKSAFDKAWRELMAQIVITPRVQNDLEKKQEKPVNNPV